MYVIPATVTSDTLSKLNTSIDTLPQKCQQLLEQAARSQTLLGIVQLDPITISLLHSKEMTEKLEDENKILKLSQRNAQLQAKIDRNKSFLDCLRKELESSKNSLAAQNPNPGNIQDHIRQTQQKVILYEESCEKAKIKLAKLNVPETIYPKSLQALVDTLVSLELEAKTLKEQADDVLFAREARNTICRLQRQQRYH